MKIDNIFVDGFGKFHNYELKNIPKGLTVLIGPNEAGKSTILCFIKRILFGFPDKRSKQNLYPPLAGGKHGGRLTVSTDENKRYVLERYSDRNEELRIILPDGSIAGEIELSRLLGHANSEIFENIYAFSLSELQDFETLNSEAVKERLYSAGRGIGAVSFAEVQRSMESEAGELFKEHGSKPEINNLFKEINETNLRLKEITNDLERFDNLHKEKEGVSQEIKRIEQERNHIRNTLFHVQNLVKVWDDWRKIQETKKLLQGLPAIESFPEGGIQLLEKSVERIEELDKRIAEKKAGLEKVVNQKSKIGVDEKLIENREGVFELQKGQDKYNSALNDIPILESRMESSQESLRGQLLEIGPNWNEDKLSRFDISIPAKETVRKRYSDIEKTSENIRDAEKEVQIIEKKARDTREEIGKITQQIQICYPSKLDEKNLNQQKKSLQFLRSKCSQLETVEKEIQDIAGFVNGAQERTETINKEINIQLIQQLDEAEVEQRRKSVQLLRINYPKLKEIEVNARNIQEKKELLDLFKPHRTAHFLEIPLWPVFMLGGAGIIVLISLVVGKHAVLGMFVFIILSIIALIYFSIRKKQLVIKTAEDLESKEASDLQKQTNFSEREQKLEEELLKLTKEMLSYSKICGFDDIPEPHVLESRDKELEKIGESLSEIRKLNEKREKLEVEFQQLRKEMLLHAREVGFNDIPKMEVIGEKEIELEKISTSLFEMNKLKERQQTIEQALVSFNKEILQLQIKLKEQQEKYKTLQNEWKTWLIKEGLEPELSPEGVIEVFSTVKTCIEKKKSIKEIVVRLDSIKKFVTEYEDKFGLVIGKCHRQKKNVNVMVELEKISEELNIAIANRDKLEQFNKEEENLKLEIGGAEKTREEKRNKFSMLLAEGSAKSEAEFRKNAKNWEEREKYEDEILQKEQIIRKISGDGKSYNDFTKELESTNLEILKGQEVELKEKFEDIEKNHSVLREKLGSTNKEIEQIEKREEGAFLRMKKALKMEMLRKKVEEWSILVLARAIMRKAIEKYERERQPGIIKEAQSLFFKTTREKYSRIYAPLGEARIYVEDENGRRKEIQELSRGTAEQLYLSLRFGFIREFSRRSEPLPIILDDVLVNFDSERTAATCEIIKGLAKNYQIFYFTCHPETVNILTATVPDLNKAHID